MAKLITLTTGEIFDTTVLLPHVECYIIKENKLYAEYIYDGTLILIGEIKDAR